MVDLQFIHFNGNWWSIVCVRWMEACKRLRNCMVNENYVYTICLLGFGVRVIFFCCFFPCVCEQARNMNPIHVDDHFFPPFFVFCICMQIRWNDAMHQPNSPGKIRQTHSFRALNVAVVVVGLLISLLIFHYKDYNHAYKICDAVRLLIGWL